MSDGSGCKNIETNGAAFVTFLNVCGMLLVPAYWKVKSISGFISILQNPVLQFQNDQHFIIIIIFFFLPVPL
jgi:hypothetical protein